MDNLYTYSFTFNYEDIFVDVDLPRKYCHDAAGDMELGFSLFPYMIIVYDKNGGAYSFVDEETEYAECVTISKLKTEVKARMRKPLDPADIIGLDTASLEKRIFSD